MDDMWNIIRDVTIAGLKKNNHTNRLVITGISLGGALTALSFVDIRQAQVFDNIEIVTFGSPRVGNKKWASWFDEQTSSVRYTLSEDPIPVLPRCLTLLCNYGFIGTKVQCRKDSKTCHCMEEDYPDSPNTKIPSFRKIAENVVRGALEHITEEEHQWGGFSIGILDHINEYKNVKDYSLVC